MPVGPLGPLGQVVGQLVGLEVDRRHLRHHPVVQLLVGELLAQECFHFLSLFDLLFVVDQLLFSNLHSDLGRFYLFAYLL